LGTSLFLQEATELYCSVGYNYPADDLLQPTTNQCVGNKLLSLLLSGYETLIPDYLQKFSLKAGHFPHKKRREAHSLPEVGG
jgi:hypothetical protein